MEKEIKKNGCSVFLRDRFGFNRMYFLNYNPKIGDRLTLAEDIRIFEFTKMVGSLKKRRPLFEEIIKK